MRTTELLLTDTNGDELFCMYRITDTGVVVSELKGVVKPEKVEIEGKEIWCVKLTVGTQAQGNKSTSLWPVDRLVESMFGENNDTITVSPVRKLVIRLSIAGVCTGIYIQSKEAAGAMDCSPQLLSQAVKNGCKAVGWYWKQITTIYSATELLGRIFVVRDGRDEGSTKHMGRSRALIKSLDPVTGEVVETYTSQKKAANAVGCTPSALSQAIRSGSKVKGWSWSREYTEDEDG